jgi:hypothetical protein
MQRWWGTRYGYGAVVRRGLVGKERHRLGPLVCVLRSGASCCAQSGQQRGRGSIVGSRYRWRRRGEAVCCGRRLCSALQSALPEE